jgi:hypothetical protein
MNPGETSNTTGATATTGTGTATTGGTSAATGLSNTNPYVGPNGAPDYNLAIDAAMNASLNGGPGINYGLWMQAVDNYAVTTAAAQNSAAASAASQNKA